MLATLKFRGIKLVSDAENTRATLAAGMMTHAEHELFARVDQIDSMPKWAELNADELQAITARESVDFATAVLYRALLRSEQHGSWIEMFERQDVTDQPLDASLLVGIVPGGCHEESEDSRRSLRRVYNEVAGCGVETEIIPVHSFGCLPDQAAVIIEWLKIHADRAIVLVSLSKGTAEVKLAMRDDPCAFGHVRAWVNVSGLIYGSQWINWLLNRAVSRWAARVWCWYWKYPHAAFQQLRRGPSELTDFELDLPGHMEVIHIYGFPTTDRLSHRYTKRSHMRLAAHGPSDGMGVMLGDLPRLSGRVYPVWAADHFLQSDGFDFLLFVRRVLKYVTARQYCPEHRSGE